eukprot:4397178-Alexandrium_andersonii.AAC.1
MSLQGGAADGAICNRQLSSETHDPVGDFQKLGPPRSTSESLDGELRVRVDGDSLRTKLPG